MTTPQKGEWYLGAKCPTCGEMAVHAPDPAKGQGDVKKADGDRHVLRAEASRA